MSGRRGRVFCGGRLLVTTCAQPPGAPLLDPCTTYADGHESPFRGVAIRSPLEYHGAEYWTRLPRPFMLTYDWPRGEPRPPASGFAVRTGRRTAALFRLREPSSWPKPALIIATRGLGRWAVWLSSPRATWRRRRHGPRLVVAAGVGGTVTLADGADGWEAHA